MVGKKIIQSQGKVREVYFAGVRKTIDILKKSQGKLKKINTVDSLVLKTGRDIWGNCHLNDIYLQ